jgi:hypothetical protein
MGIQEARVIVSVHRQQAGSYEGRVAPLLNPLVTRRIFIFVAKQE